MKELKEIAEQIAAKYDCQGSKSRISLRADFLAALQQAYDLGRAGHCHCKWTGEIGREKLIHECQLHAKVRLRETGALRDLLRDVDARLSLDGGFQGMGHNIAVESAGRMRVDAEYARKVLAALDARAKDPSPVMP